MRAVVQRVTRASSSPGGSIGPGLCILLGVAAGDGPDDARRLARKIANLRIFAGDDGRFDRSLGDIGGAALVVSQFTLLADTAKGNRPSFSAAAGPGDGGAAVRAVCGRAARPRDRGGDRRLRGEDGRRARE